MTKKDYELTARGIFRLYSVSSVDMRHAIKQVVGHLVSEYKNDNPKFNKDKFIKACGIKEEQ